MARCRSKKSGLTAGLLTALDKVLTDVRPDWVLAQGDTTTAMAAMAFSCAGAKPTMSFFEQSEDAGGIISRINTMAAAVNEKMFGRTTAAAQPAPAAAAAAPPPQAAQPAPTDPFAHPEKMLKQSSGSGGGAGSPFAASEESAREFSPQFWKSAAYKMAFNGIALGDVDGDGKPDILQQIEHGALGLVINKPIDITLKDLFTRISVSQCIIYCNSIRRVSDLAEAMTNDGFPVCCIHSGMEKEVRDKAYKPVANAKVMARIMGPGGAGAIRRSRRAALCPSQR